MTKDYYTAYLNLCKHSDDADGLLYDVFKALEDMTTGEFASGGDRELRLKIKEFLGLDEE
jgi:hypothetical protein